MRKLSAGVLLVASFMTGGASMARADCWDLDRIADAAYDFAYDAAQFADDASQLEGYNQLVGEANQLADQGNRLGRSAERGARCRRIQEQFDEIVSHAVPLKDHAVRIHSTRQNPYMERDWSVLERSYHNLQDAVEQEY
jgi:hypothetical protein